MKRLSAFWFQNRNYFNNSVFMELNASVLLLLFCSFSFCSLQAAGYSSQGTKLSEMGLSVIPYPQQVQLMESDFTFGNDITIVIDENASDADRFAAEDLADRLQDLRNIRTEIKTTAGPGDKSIRLTRREAPDEMDDQGYRLATSTNQITIESSGEAGLFYGAQTLTQLIKEEDSGLVIPGMEITDWPDIPERAIHYDTKHSQDKESYVKSFIRDLAHYKVNMLVWEWEDKFAYPSHPEIGAPGAFTMEEMQEFTRYAKKYHIQIVPLVQGLGHVSFILKWPHFAHLSEIEASNWEFCPLKDGTYDLLFDLWEDAMEATPGSKYIHIGSDETYELGEGVECGCHAKAEEIGRSGLFHLFLDRSASHLQSLGREVMAWERPMGWEESSSPIQGGASRAEGLVLTESYSWMSPPDYPEVVQSRELGHKVFVYDPNPGIEPLFLPYFYKEQGKAHVIPGTAEKEYRTGSLEDSYNTLTSAANSGVFDGMIRTSWDDAGLHNQAWMMQFILAAEFSWSGENPSLDEFQDSFYKNYYGNNVENADELFRLLNEASYYYWDTLERKVWHFGTIGKTRLPDLPRGDALEYDRFWNSRHEGMIKRSEEMNQKMEQAIEICDINISNSVKNSYDFEIFRTIAELVQHTSRLYLDMSAIENSITEAHQQRFVDHTKAYESLHEAVNTTDNMLNRRHRMFDSLVTVWEKTRLPKGFSTEDQEFFHRQDRARHFAFRTADMTFLIYDEQLLNVEEYLENLRYYTEWYKETYLD